MRNNGLLTEAQVLELLAVYRLGTPVAEIGRLFGVSGSSVSYHVRRSGIESRRGAEERLRAESRSDAARTVRSEAVLPPTMPGFSERVIELRGMGRRVTEIAAYLRQPYSRVVAVFDGVSQ